MNAEKYPKSIIAKLLPLFIAVVTLLPFLAHAATVDGQPTYHPRSDTGLYVWRTGAGNWHVRLLSAAGPRKFNGDFDSTQPISSVRPVEMEAADRATKPSADVLRISYEAWPGGLDGTDFTVAAGSGLCLRNVGGPATVAYLGSNAVPANIPIDLTGSGACGTAAAADDGLYISRAAGGDWQVRLLSDGAPQQFNGTFEAAQPFQRVKPVSLESSDNATLSTQDTMNTRFETWPGGYDGVDFAVSNNGGVCLRDAGGSDAQVYLGTTHEDAIAVTMPLDLTGSDACGESTVPPPPPPPIGGRKFNAGHYIALMRGNDKQTVMADSIHAGVVGFMKRYTWRELEPSLGQYDFSEISSDLAYVSSQGMHLIVMIEDKTFANDVPTPAYLQGSQYTRANRAGGYTAVRWAPYVVTRMTALVTALGQRFDANPSFEGIATQETAPGLDNAVLSATGYTPEKYRDAIIGVLTAAAKSAPKSRVFWMMNFFPQKQSYIGTIANALAPHGVVMGGPDVLPDEHALQLHTYPFYKQFEGKMPLFGQIEPACYSHMHADTSYPTDYWTMPELFRYGRDNLKVNYMFWVRLPKASPINSYDWNDALPVIANEPVFNQ